MRELQHAEGGNLPSVHSLWNNDGVLVITRRSLLAGLLSTAAAVPARSAFNCGGYVGGMDLGSGDMTATVLTDGTSWLHYTPDQICGQFRRGDAEVHCCCRRRRAFRLMRKMLLRDERSKHERKDTMSTKRRRAGLPRPTRGRGMGTATMVCPNCGEVSRVLRTKSARAASSRDTGSATRRVALTAFTRAR
jgi:hypothetical protein